MVGVSLNVTIVNPTASSFLTVFPADVNRPLTANLNWLANQPPTPNAVTVALSSDGKMSIYNLSGSVDFTIDVFGYYEPASSGPPGATGPIGPQGIAGPKGDPGVNGINDSDPATFVRGHTSVTSCVAILTPPVGRAVVVRSIHINVYQNTTPGFGNNVLLYIGTGCVGGFLEAVNPATIGMVDLSYEPGVIIPAGSSLFANRQNNVAAEVLAIGYSVLASAAVPIATLDESRSSTPGPNVDGADS